MGYTLKMVSPSPPTLSQVLQILEQIRRMEHLTATIQYTLPQFAKVWDLWDHSKLNPGATLLCPSIITPS